MNLCYELLLLVAATEPVLASPLSSLARFWPRFFVHDLAANSTTASNSTNSSAFIWLPQDEYSGETFFDGFIFYTSFDPTHGTVSYVNATYAFDNGLAYYENSNNTVVMKGDDTSWLQEGQNRVRISSIAQYNTGLFILDLNRAPWGCGVWPAFCMLLMVLWSIPLNMLQGQLEEGHGHIQAKSTLLRAVHDNEHNQVTWHTGPECWLWYHGMEQSFVWSPFEAQGGGIFAMKWDDTGIAGHFVDRSAIPGDIKAGSPNPANWGTPVASLAPETCDPLTFFVNHSIIFDITFCGDWAGNSYATSGCPGSCSTRLMDPTNFVNASWSINSLKVYKKQAIIGRVSGVLGSRTALNWAWPIMGAAAIAFLLP
ncbi:glycoside hydrolase family 16 protein [Mycena amicta]|nr:glycoside hydrolase family 16 protein [Mycena amicta]